MCWLTSGSETGANQDFVGAIKSGIVRRAHMVTRLGLML